METVDPDARWAEVTAELAWLRRLARALLRTDEGAGDLAHDAWLVAAEHAPGDGRPLRPWLARVTLNLARMSARARGRREARELAAIAAPGEPAPTPAQLVERVELQRMVADAVLQLAEPARSTVLLHYFEELTCAEIARRLAVPEGTVRRRLKTALDELRGRIAAREAASGRGLAALAPLAALAKPLVPAAPLALGVIAMKKLAAALAVILVLLVVALWWHHGGGTRSHPGAAGEHARPAADSPTTGTTATADARGGASVPAWLVQQGASARKIAGRVTFHGQPIAGATVELASIASEAGFAAPVSHTTDAAGAFDFGAQPATTWSVRASAPHHTAIALDVDARDPLARPAPDRLELELGACDAALVGTVRDASGGTIAKAHITRLGWARPIDPPAAVPGGASVTTDDAGGYELCVEARWPGWVAVEVGAHGYGTIVYSGIVPGRVKADFALVPEATIVGRVVRDDTGAPVPQAYVYLPQGSPGTTTTAWRGAIADDAGRFKLDGVAPGHHLVMARGAGMVAARGTPIVVEAGQTTAELVIRLEAGATISGRVVSHGAPIAGARVAPVVPGNGPAAATALSQSDGSFVLAEVPRGTIRFTAAPYEVATPHSFAVSEREHTGITLEVEALGSVVGHVIRTKQPVAGANIEINGPNDRELAPVHADADGRFEIHGLRPGPWTVYASNEHIGAFGGPQVVHVERGATVEVTIDIKYAGAISGTVVDQTGVPVPGLTVWFRSTTTDDGGLAVSALDGTFRAATLTGGVYRPTVGANADATAQLRPAAGSAFPVVTVDGPDAEVTGVQLAVQLDHLTIAGTVVDATGAPVPDARVVAELVERDEPGRFYRGLQDPAATTDVDGHFTIGDLLAGRYALQARLASGTSGSLGGVQAGRGDVTIVLPAGGEIDGTLVGFRDPPEVSAVSTDPSGAGATLYANAQGGAFVLHDLSPGSYLVTARTPAEAASAVVTVASGRPSQLALTSRGSGAVTGHVHEFRSGAPIEGISCVASPRSGNSVAPDTSGSVVHTDATGAFAITAAPAGDVAVLCFGLWRLYSDGARAVTVGAQPLVVDVPVVAWRDDAHTIGDFGAEFDPQVLAPRLVRVVPGGPAARAGLANGDVIVAVDGAETAQLSQNGVWILVANRPPGSKVKLTVARGAAQVNVELVLGEQHS